ncbi:MAG TPA: NYN domain-containing protein [Solirubrobacteraceae bacterium]|nr:NYN domain-containing protein [Solirubrobacteraceae bacterium]
MSVGLPRIAVFIDWQNVYKTTAREAFDLTSSPNERGNFAPLKLARILAAGNGRGKDARLLRVEIHRGLPSSRWDPVGFGANRRQAAAWRREAGDTIVPRQRPLRYLRGSAQPGRPVEKGIDVALALGVVEALLTNVIDVAVLFTHDSDLRPAVEMIARLRGANRIETASWSSRSFSRRLGKVDGVHHHTISRRVFEMVETPVNYAHVQNV